jgi:hypothetical protein
MTQPDRGRWAWGLFRDSDQLWEQIYHGDPRDHLVDPRQLDLRQLEEPALAAQKPVIFDPTTAVAHDDQEILDRAEYDNELHGHAFGR